MFVMLPVATVREIKARAESSNAAHWEVIAAAISATKDCPPICGRGKLWTDIVRLPRSLMK